MELLRLDDLDGVHRDGHRLASQAGHSLFVVVILAKELCVVYSPAGSIFSAQGEDTQPLQGT